MGKYDRLSDYLRDKKRPVIPLTFGEIEKILGFPLPPSQTSRAWWSNNPDNNVMTKAWLMAGYETEKVDIEGRTVVFRRATATNTTDAGVEAEGKPQGRHPLFGAMKGTFTIAPGVDLTEPADPEWAELVDHPDWGKMP